MAAAKKAAAKGPKRGAHFKVEGAKVTTAKKYCPRCGPGFMMADHKDRTTCGKCGYTEFRK
ncbi:MULTISPECIES: 30S ribosomal protein S27ae [unclassified Methanoregula]|uniref:30S ribosomal protein S27ae n=1 Tax=unclassified Methanoregula TaxID=2649730 RepID=UPI0009D29A37|nr:MULTISPECIES: 30S ribosomal protein S27ae [unclassified Methanoregula]OPX61715.1 MAG: 30S ribosomal protein S27ae [Methanoregula sp. PtaB.Bin085]OPY33976.1 MAG: 30S ribosomal protein S27ae [Methanoregula sp. PtaU1.Bin006]